MRINATAITVAVISALVLMLFATLAGAADQSINLDALSQKIFTQGSKPWWVEYFFPALAIFAAPFAGIKITTRFRDFYRAAFGRAGTKAAKVRRWALYNFVHFFSTGLCASICWYAKYEDVYQTLVVGFMVAVLQTTITAIAFFLIGLFSKDLAHDMKEGAYRGHDGTLIGSINTVLFGSRQDMRTEPREGGPWTEEQRKQYRQGSQTTE